ncbi:hypothetical protein VTP01DRAFT_10108 [Rhizomucor pusillus]|uniref:uncharacterized protein n=1 Tax=Rhizomucor pusillus TaxID=4840 RepID=UPI0037434456
MTTANDVDFEELLTRFDRVTKTLADAPLDQHLGEAKDIARQIQVTLDAKTEASSENLAELQAEYSRLQAKESELAADLEATTRRCQDASGTQKQTLESSISEEEQSIQSLQEEISRLKQELYKYDDVDDMNAMDPTYLQLLIYRGLGIRMIQGEDGTFSKIRLISDDKRNIHEYQAKDYTPYFVAKYIWDYIAYKED